jgi:hypothetical protein
MTRVSHDYIYSCALFKLLWDIWESIILGWGL